MNPKYTLKIATQKDAEFLFRVKNEAMRPITPVSEIESFDHEKEFAKYLQKFEPEKIQIIQFEGKDIGRLRIVRSLQSIYVGGIQILPEFQGKGTGTAILKDLITESEVSEIPITLEVQHVNEKAISFYKRLGFKDSGKTQTQVLMVYSSTQ